MSWIMDYWRPKITPSTKEESIQTTEILWENCKSCEKMEYNKIWQENMFVCQSCNYHKIISPELRFNMILDEGFIPITLTTIQDDPIQFSDRKTYLQRLQELRVQGKIDAIQAVSGSINKIPAIVAVMDFDFIGGSMGMYVGQAIVKLCTQAQSEKLPLIIFCSSGGARMQEGIYSLMQMPRTVLVIERLKAKGIPVIIVLTNPTMGGVLASFASLGDITLAEPAATIGFSGRRVIENTLRQTLPDDFQTSEFQRAHGFVDQIVNRKKLKSTLSRVLRLIYNKS